MKSIHPFLIVFAGCGTELSPKVINDHPEVSILSHVDGSVFLEGETVRLHAQVGDANHALSDLRVTWLLDDQMACEDQIPESSGSVACDFNMLAGSEQIYVQVVDPDGAAAMDTIAISVPISSPPVVFIMSPADGSAYTTADAIPFQGVVSDDDDAPESLAIFWQSNLDGVLPITVLPDSNGSFANVIALSEGQHFIELSVTDTAGKRTVENTFITVEPPNTAPTCSIASPISGSVFAFGESILFEAQVGDSDQAAVTLDVRWTSDKDGEFAVSTPDSNGSVFGFHSGLSMDTHAITLSVTDNAGFLCTETLLLTVGGPPMVLIDEPSQGAVYTQTDWIDFVATVSDNEDSPADILLDWESALDGMLLAASQSASGVHQFSRDNLSPGHHLLTATATDSHGQIASAWVEIRINTPPDLQSLSLSPTPALSNQDIASTFGGVSDPDGDPVMMSYQWLKDGVLTSNSTSVLPASETTKNQVWTLIVTPNDGYEDGNSLQANVNIINSPPEINGLSLSANTPTVVGSSILTAAVVDFDADGDTVSHHYQWRVNGAVVGGNAPMLDGNVHFSRGDTVTLDVTPDDGEEVGVLASTSVVVGNAPPTAPNWVEITPDPAVHGDSLTCTALGSVDPDQDPISLIYSWTQNGFVWGGATSNNGSVIPSGNAVAGDSWICEAYASDGIDNSAVVQSSSVLIASHSISIPCDHCITLPNGAVVGLNEIPSGVLFGGNALSNDYLMMTTEVTQDMFFELMGYNDSQYNHPGQPVENVTWHEAAAFANALSAYEGWPECYTCNLTVNNDPASFSCTNNGNYYGSNIYLCPGYRLPTDAEWEHAARIGVGYHFWTANGGGSLNPADHNNCDPSIFLTDNSPLSDLAWFCGNAGQPQMVGQKDPNGYGIYDFHGNVAEWCQDTYSNWWPVGINPVSTGGVSNVLRGGHWDSQPIELDVGLRENDYPNTRNAIYGFRLVRILP